MNESRERQPTGMKAETEEEHVECENGKWWVCEKGMGQSCEAWRCAEIRSLCEFWALSGALTVMRGIRASCASLKGAAFSASCASLTAMRGLRAPCAALTGAVICGSSAVLTTSVGFCSPLKEVWAELTEFVFVDAVGFRGLRAWGC